MIYHYKMGTPQVIGGGDGTKANPWYWYEKTQGQTISLNNQNTSSDDHCRLYVRVKLQAGKDYAIGETRPGGGDGMIWLYDEQGSQLTYDDDAEGEIAGVQCSDHLYYSPETTGIYIIGAGSYSSAKGSYTLAISELPQADPPPTPQIIYPTSEGFNEQGKPIKYRSATSAGVGLTGIPEDSLLYYNKLEADVSTEETGKGLTYYGKSNISWAFDQDINNNACTFNGGVITLSQYITIPHTVTISIWAKYDSTTKVWMLHMQTQYGSTYDICLRKDLSGTLNDGWTYQKVDVPSSYADNKWHHFVVTYDHGALKLYVDSVFIAENNGDDVGGYSAPVSLGSNWQFSDGSDDFHGSVMAARVYSRVLDDKEIKALFKEFHPK